MEETEIAAVAMEETEEAAVAMEETAVAVEVAVDLTVVIAVAVVALAVAVEVAAAVASVWKTKFSLTTRFMSPASPPTSMKTTLLNFSDLLESSRTTRGQASKRSGSTRTETPGNKKEKPQSPTTILKPLKAPSLGLMEKISTVAQSKYRWPWSEPHLAVDMEDQEEEVEDLAAADSVGAAE